MIGMNTKTMSIDMVNHYLKHCDNELNVLLKEVNKNNRNMSRYDQKKNWKNRGDFMEFEGRLQDRKRILEVTKCIKNYINNG